MQITDKIFASYLDCEYKGYLKFIGKSGIKTELENLNNETLNNIKEHYIETISSKIKNEYIQKDLLITTEVLRNGFHYLFNNSIQNNEIANTLDVLVRKTGESFLGNYFYEPMLILPNFKITKREKLLLTFKSILISNLQKKLLSTGKIIYGKPVKALTVRFSGLHDEANTIISKIRQFSNNEKSPNFFLNKHCNFCEFGAYCYDKAKEADCLSLFTGMKQKEITKLNNKGFFTVNQLSYTFKPRKRVKKSSKVVKKHYYALKALAIRKNKVYVYEKPDLPSPSVKIYLDVEGNPDRNLFYLIGLVIETRTSLKDYSFWINDESETKKKTRLFLDIINRYKDFTIYHYGNYETRFLNFIKNSTNKRKDGEIKNAIHKSVNVLSLMNTAVYFPTYSSGLKEIANYLGFSWTIDNSSGIQSIVWRRKWEKEEDQKLKNNLILYNKEDCLALRVLVRFLLSANNKKNNSETKSSIESVDNLVDRNSDRYGGHEFRKINFCLKEFEHINQCAYFDYQKNKILVRTGKSTNRKLKNSSKQHRFKYKPNKEILIPKSRVCPKCKSKKIKTPNKRVNSKVVVDLKFFNGGIKRWVIKYNYRTRYCANCGKSFMPKKYKAIRGKYGHGIISWTIYQNISNHAGLEKTKKTLFDCFQVSIKNSSLYELKIKAACFF